MTFCMASANWDLLGEDSARSRGVGWPNSFALKYSFSPWVNPKGFMRLANALSTISPNH